MAPKVAEAAEAAAGAGRAKKSAKQKVLEQITSLDDDDDERASISKKISWILRHGARKVNIKITDDGWVTIADLNKTEILEEVPRDKLVSVIAESNAQKPRYELKDSSGGPCIKAISKTERKAAAEKVSRAVPNTKGVSSAAGKEKDSTIMRTDAPVFVPGTTPMPEVPTTFAPPAHPGFPGYPYPFGAQAYPYPFGAPGYSPLMTGMQPYGAMAPPVAPAAAAAPMASGRFRGKIKAFNVEKGFGFIECQEAHAKYGRDVFLHKAHIGDLPVGSEVTFAVELNKQGMPQARDLATNQGMVPGPPSKGKDGKGKGKGKSGDGDAKGKGRGKGKKDKKDGAKGEAKDASAGDANASDTAAAPKAEEKAPAAEVAEAPAAAP